MEYLHCNNCGHLPQFSDQRRYFISSCGHLFCQNCVGRCKETCSVCSLKCRIIEVNAQSKQEIKIYFMDPLAVLRESLKQTSQVMSFQKTQLKSYQSVVGKILETHRRTLHEMNSLKQNLAAMQQECESLKQNVEAMKQEQQTWAKSIPRNPFPIFGDQRSATSFGSQEMMIPITPLNQGTPFMISRNTDCRSSALFTPTPPNSINRNSNEPNSGGSGGVFFGGGRLTIPRTTPTLQDDISYSRRFDSPAPRTPQGQTPDIVARLRQLRCSTNSTPRPTNNTRTPSPSPSPRSFL